MTFGMELGMFQQHSYNVLSLPSKQPVMDDIHMTLFLLDLMVQLSVSIFF